MHIAATSPLAIKGEDISKEIIDKEVEIIKAELINSGKKGDLAEKISRGKIAKFISRSGKEDMHGADFNMDVKNELQSFAKEQFDKGFDYMISGHYHLGEIYNLDKGKLAVLGDWFHRPSYAKFDGEDLSINLWKENV